MPKNAFAELERYEREEPQDYEKQSLDPSKEKAFEEWTRRLIPALPKEPF